MVQVGQTRPRREAGSVLGRGERSYGRLVGHGLGSSKSWRLVISTPLLSQAAESRGRNEVKGTGGYWDGGGSS